MAIRPPRHTAHKTTQLFECKIETDAYQTGQTLGYTVILAIQKAIGLGFVQEITVAGLSICGAEAI
jgi:hypothetical protein